MEARQRTGAGPRRGIALIPAILLVAGLSVFIVALMTAVLSGNRTVVHQGEEYQLSSAVESVAILAGERLWSAYVDSEGGAAGDIQSFRDFLSGFGVDDSGPGGPPGVAEGTNVINVLGLPLKSGKRRFNDVLVDAVRLLRRDVGDATQIFITVSASTTRGEGLVNPVLNRAVQQIFTVEPAEFPGFEYALLANNVNCILCHTRIDNAKRWWNTDDSLRGTFDRVKVGTLESLLLRHTADGVVDDNDADSFLAGTLYLRGVAALTNGSPVASWSGLSFQHNPFDAAGHVEEDVDGNVGLAPFFAALGPPFDPGESLYLDYPLPYAEQTDGYLPDHFPAPFPDDGGIDPTTGLADASGAGNRVVDDAEFHELAMKATGKLHAGGVANVTPAGTVISAPLDFADAVFSGNVDWSTETIEGEVSGNVILTGLPDDPIWIDGDIAIDGDLVIQGWIKGEGSIYVRGNLYVPTDLQYADGREYLAGDAAGSPSGPRTFGIHQDGTRNALGLTAGGNVLLGDFQRPASLQHDLTYDVPGTFETISGNPDTGDPNVDRWSFVMAEIALFNRGEWARTQSFLPDASGTYTIPNPDYAPGYVPRYYAYGDDTVVPIFNLGSQYFDPAADTWLGPESAISWDATLLTYADPTNPSDPILYQPDGTPRAVVSPVSHTGGWIAPSVYKAAVEYFENQHPASDPMRLDALLYTNNAIFSIVYRDSRFAGRMLVNGSLVAADIGMLVPGKRDTAGTLSNHSPLSEWAIGLQLNYDERLRKAVSIKNPFQVTLKRTYWNPTANLL